MKLAPIWAALPTALLLAGVANAQQCACSGGRCAPGSSAGPAVHHFSCEEAFYQNQIWPRQYINPSRRGICQSLDIMAHNGWRRQNLLGPYHFEADGVQLNEAGRLKVEWILTQAPPQYRTLYVQRVANQDRTVGRVEQAVHGLQGMQVFAQTALQRVRGLAGLSLESVLLPLLHAAAGQHRRDGQHRAHQQ